MANSSLESTRYSRHCKPGLSQWNYRLSPGFQSLPTRATQLERSAAWLGGGPFLKRIIAHTCNGQ